MPDRLSFLSPCHPPRMAYQQMNPQAMYGQMNPQGMYGQMQPPQMQVQPQQMQVSAGQYGGYGFGASQAPGMGHGGPVHYPGQQASGAGPAPGSYAGQMPGYHAPAGGSPYGAPGTGVPQRARQPVYQPPAMEDLDAPMQGTLVEARDTGYGDVPMQRAMPSPGQRPSGPGPVPQRPMPLRYPAAQREWSAPAPPRPAAQPVAQSYVAEAAAPRRPSSQGAPAARERPAMGPLGEPDEEVDPEDYFGAPVPPVARPAEQDDGRVRVLEAALADLKAEVTGLKRDLQRAEATVANAQQVYEASNWFYAQADPRGPGIKVLRESRAGAEVLEEVKAGDWVMCTNPHRKDERGDIWIPAKVIHPKTFKISFGFVLAYENGTKVRHLVQADLGSRKAPSPITMPFEGPSPIQRPFKVTEANMPRQSAIAEKPAGSPPPAEESEHLGLASFENE